MNKNTGGSVYPYPAHATNKGYKNKSDGMTLRDYYIGKALAGICANPSEEWYGAKPEDIANAAVIIADQAIRAREE